MVRVSNSKIRISLYLLAVVIVVTSLIFANKVVNRLARQERQQMEVWAEATRQLLNDTYSDFVFTIVENNDHIPVVIVDEKDSCLSFRNFDLSNKDTLSYFQKRIPILKEKNPPIEISISGNENQYIYYDDSILLKQLSYYPYIQMVLIVMFVILAIWAISSEKRSEQNMVWVGLTKETAHQLGTPITSLLAWVEILKSKYPEDNTIVEMERDVNRLRTIAERFSKIGSKPELQEEDLMSVTRHVIEYMQKRTSRHITYTLDSPYQVIPVMLNKPLFEWVLENLMKNAIDAMDGEGKINISIHSDGKRLLMDVSDTGKGIDRKHFKSVFKPGYTTKKRGWGLGLSLVKRIIVSYHKGKIFVKSSELNQGTTFRIILPLTAPSHSES